MDKRVDPFRWFKFFDKTVGTVICLSIGLYDFLLGRIFRSKKKNIERILLIKTLAIGDLVVALPSFRAIKERYPQAQVTLLTLPRVKDVVHNFPWFDEIIYLEIKKFFTSLKNIIQLIRRLRKMNIDLVVEFEHYYRFTTIINYFSKAWKRIGLDLPGQGRRILFTDRVPYLYEKHEVIAFYQLAIEAGAKKKIPRLEKIVYSQEDKQKVESFLKEINYHPENPLIGLHPATSPSDTTRRWVPDRFAILAEKLQENFQAQIVFTGGPDDIHLIKGITSQMKDPAVTSAGFLSLKQFAALAEKLDLLISVDTGARHIAAAMGARIVGLCRPTSPEKWGPYGKGNKYIYHALPCSPCPKQYLGEVTRCQKNDCMLAIEVDEVYELAQEVLQEEGWPVLVENRVKED